MGTWRNFKYPMRNTLFIFSHAGMSKPRVLLISSPHLFGESMETILRAEKEIELLGPWNLGDPDLYPRLLETQPSVVVIADEDLQSDSAAELTGSIIEQCPAISVIRTGLSENVFRIFSTQTMPARGDNLLEMIRSCSSQSTASTSAGKV